MMDKEIGQQWSRRVGSFGIKGPFDVHLIDSFCVKQARASDRLPNVSSTGRIPSPTIRGGSISHHQPTPGHFESAV